MRGRAEGIGGSGEEREKRREKRDGNDRRKEGRTTREGMGEWKRREHEK